ncbi:MAG: hypothetical protein J7L55_05915 [Desulfurococcales archaeon]|nr:hypothetical protein [Desulfurococcales archaeon]
MYYAGFGWLPTAIVVDRVLRFVIPSSPLTPWLFLDLAVVIAVEALTAYLFLGRRGLVLGVTASAISLAGFTSYAMTSMPAFLCMLSASALLTLYAVREGLRLQELLRWVASLLIVFEVVIIGAVLTHFGLGGEGFALAAVMRDRVMWCFAEWLSIAALFIAAGYWLSSLMRGGRVGKAFPRLGGAGEGSSGALRAFLRSPWVLVLAEVLVVFAVLLPHLPTVNPSGAPVSVDTFYYLRFIVYADTHGLPEALRAMSGFARPAYLSLIYLLSRLIPPEFLMDFIHPLIALSLLMLASYHLGRRLGGDEVGGFAALLTPFGHASITFIAGGFQANSLALPAAVFLLGAEPSSLGTIFVLGLLVALIHPWTFLMYSAAYVVLARVRGASWKGCVKVVAVLGLALGIAELVGHFLASVSPAGAATHTVTSSLGLYFPRNLFRGVEFWTWGSQANALIFTAASIPAGFTPISALMGVEFPLLLIGSSVIAHRLLLNTPLEIQASILLRELPTEIILLVIITTIARGLEILTGMTPLVGGPWEAILYRPP